jgi:transposase-like protein
MFPVSYRDLELMLLDRGVEVDRTTIFRWRIPHIPGKTLQQNRSNRRPNRFGQRPIGSIHPLA